MMMAAHFHLRVVLHDLLDTSERQRRVSVVGNLFLGRIDLTLPERGQEVLQLVAGLDER